MMGYVGIVLSDSLFSEVTIAPENDELYQHEADLYHERCYIVKTVNGCYAKIKVHYPEQGIYTNIVEYVYQSDGSRILTLPVSIEATSWGRIKALFR